MCMDLRIEHDIDHNIFSTVIAVESLGTELLSESEERELLNDFPSKIKYKNLLFTRNVKLNGSLPEVTDEEVTDETNTSIVTVSLPSLANKEILLDETFEVMYRIDVSKVPASAIDDNVLTSAELVAQAYCIVYDAVICDAIKEIMENLRAKAPLFSGETLVNI